MKKSVLFLAGGWDGHQPHETAALFSALLAAHDCDCETALMLDVDNLTVTAAAVLAGSWLL